MSVATITVLALAVFMVLLLIGVPVAFAMLAIAVGGYLMFVGPSALYAITGTVFRTVTTDVFIAVPLFIFMATLLEVSGIGQRLYEAMYKWMAGLRGGLGMGTVGISTVLAATTGLSSTATVMMGLLAYPEMRKRHYDKGIAMGAIMAGGALGPLIPPSLPAIVIGGLTSVSTGKLFIAGVIPGLLSSLLFIVYIGVRCLRNSALGPPIPLAERANWSDKLSALWALVAPVFLILLVLGGIYAGIFTPTEAGGVGAIGALACAAIFRNLTLKNLQSAVTTSFRATVMVMWLALAGSAFASLYGRIGASQYLGTVLVSLPGGLMGILIIMLLIVFILGMFLDTLAIIMICLPIMMPVAMQLGVDPLFFAFLFMLDIIIGMISPPFGYVLFYFKGLGFADVEMADIYRSVIPYVILLTFVLVFVVVFPDLALWLPNQMIR